MTWLESYRLMQRLTREFSETDDVAKRVEIRKRQKAVLRSFNPPPLTTMEKHSAIIAQGE
jgi:hypothetical protein